MAPLLPSRPNLDHLRHEAKALLKAHRRADAGVCSTLRLLHRFAEASDEEVLSADVALHEVQYALAMDYGFASCQALKDNVVSRLADASTGPRVVPAYPFSYESVDKDGQRHSGVVQARDVDDAIIRVRTLGFLPTKLQRENMPSQERAAGAEDSEESLAHRAAELMLLQAVVAGDFRIVFDCTRQNAALQLWIEDQNSPLMPFPNVASADALSALRSMSGEEELGRRTVSVRRVVTTGERLPDYPTRRCDLTFSSDENRAGQVSVVFDLPGSSGPRRTTREQTIAGIVEMHRPDAILHVLTRTEEMAVEIGHELAERLSPEQIGLVSRASKWVPETPIVVSTAADMCFILLRARMAGPDERDKFKEELQRTEAACVNVDRSYARTPCEIRQTGDFVLASMRIWPFLTLYGSVTEFEEVSE